MEQTQWRASSSSSPSSSSVVVVVVVVVAAAWLKPFWLKAQTHPAALCGVSVLRGSGMLRKRKAR
eukprot:2667841-Pyramimonas_sp.AAC.1